MKGFGAPPSQLTRAQLCERQSSTSSKGATLCIALLARIGHDVIEPLLMYLVRPEEGQAVTSFDRAFELLIGHEGGFTLDRANPGNWTSGAPNKGLLRGTKFGISAASFPTLDIQALTLGDARAINRRLYWDRVRGDELPPALALLVFDSAVNNGVTAAVKLLQASIGTPADGLIGPATLAALGRALGNGSPDRVTAIAAEFGTRRIVLMAALSTWPTFGLGWARRLALLPFQATGLFPCKENP